MKNQTVCINKRILYIFLFLFFLIGIVYLTQWVNKSNISTSSQAAIKKTPKKITSVNNMALQVYTLNTLGPTLNDPMTYELANLVPGCKSLKINNEDKLLSMASKGTDFRQAFDTSTQDVFTVCEGFDRFLAEKNALVRPAVYFEIINRRLRDEIKKIKFVVDCGNEEDNVHDYVSQSQTYTPNMNSLKFNLGNFCSYDNLGEYKIGISALLYGNDQANPLYQVDGGGLIIRIDPSEYELRAKTDYAFFAKANIEGYSQDIEDKYIAIDWIFALPFYFSSDRNINNNIKSQLMQNNCLLDNSLSVSDKYFYIGDTKNIFFASYFSKSDECEDIYSNNGINFKDIEADFDCELTLYNKTGGNYISNSGIRGCTRNEIANFGLVYPIVDD